MSAEESYGIYLREAKELEGSRQFKLAEKLYLEAGKYDLAIDMYKKERLRDNVIQLVAKYKKVHQVVVIKYAEYCFIFQLTFSLYHQSNRVPPTG